MTEDTALARRRLYWQCRRGMLELDTLLMNFLDQAYDELPAQDQQAFQELLRCEDDVLLEYLMGHRLAEDSALARIIDRVRHCPMA